MAGHLMVFFFFFNDTATTEIYTLSLHDALPISGRRAARLLLAGDVYPPGDERAQRGDVGAGWDGADLLDARLALAPAHRLTHRRAAHDRARVRLPARLVERRPGDRLRPLRQRCDRARAARPDGRHRASPDGERRGERRAALVA